MTGLFALEHRLALSDLLAAANDAEALQARIEQLVAQEADLQLKISAVKRELNEKQSALGLATVQIKDAASKLS